MIRVGIIENRQPDYTATIFVFLGNQPEIGRFHPTICVIKLMDVFYRFYGNK